MRQDSPVLGKLFNKNIFNLEFLFFFFYDKEIKATATQNALYHVRTNDSRIKSLGLNFAGARD